MNEMIVRYQLMHVRRKQLEENDLLKLTDYLVADDYVGFEKYLQIS
ncbi:hypothetical protein [Lactobacillus paragasseri]